MLQEDEYRLSQLRSDQPGLNTRELAARLGLSKSAVDRFIQAQKKVITAKDNDLIKLVKLNDWHVPYEDVKAVNCAINFCEATQPDIIIIDEVHDFYELSRFDKDPARKHDTQAEIDIATRYFRRLRKACPDSRIILLNSNHLDRLRRFLWKEGSALAGLRCLQIESLLELKELDFEYRENFFFKKVLFKHGDLVRKYAAYTAKGEFEKEGCAGASGHTHRLGIHFTTKRGGSYCWVEGGCLCQLNPEYINGVPDWQHGIVQFTFENNGTQYFPQAIPIIHGKIIHDGRVIKG